MKKMEPRTRSQPTVTFRLPDRRSLARLNREAANAGIDVSAYIRRALLHEMLSDEREDS
jgi:hypothetical protein